MPSEATLEELGYETYSPVDEYKETRGGEKTKQPSLTRKEVTLEELGYETMVPMEQARATVAARIPEGRRTPGPGPGLISPEEIPSSIVLEERNNQVLKRKYGDKFNRDYAYSNLPVIWDLGYSDRFSEKKEKFLDYFPDGDIKQENIGGSKVTLARESKDQPYRVMEGSILPMIFSGETIGGVAGVAAAPFTGGGSLAMAGLTGLGTGIGAMTQYGIEEARGYQHTPLQEGVVNAAMMAGTAGALDLVTLKTGRLLGLTSPGKNVPTPKGTATTRRAERSRRDLKLRPLMRGQVSDFPLIPQIFRQASATTRSVGRKTDIQEKELLNSLRRLSDSDLESVSDENLQRMMHAQRIELEKMFGNPPEATPDQFGSSLKEAIDRYETVSGKAKNRLYNKAKLAGDDLVFDLTVGPDGGAKAAAAKYLKGIKGRGPRGEEVTSNFPMSDKLRKKLEEITSFDDRIQKYVDKDGDEFSPIEQLQQLRATLYDFMVDGEGIDRKVAHDIWSKLRMSLENPVAGNEKAVELLGRANTANAIREANLQIGSIARAIKNDEPGKLVGYFAPKNENAVRTIKELSGKKFEEIKNNYLGTLVAHPESGLTQLRSLQKDKGTLRQIMDVGKEKQLQKYLESASRLNKSKLFKMQEKQLNRAHRVQELANEGREALEQTIKITGGPESQFAEDARRGLLRQAVDNATVVSQDGEQILSSYGMKQELNRMLRNEQYSPLFTDKFKSQMEDLLSYLSKTDRGESDMGASLEVAGLAASAKSVTNLSQMLAGWTGAGLNVITAGLLSRPKLFIRIAESDGMMNEEVLRGLTQVVESINEEAEGSGESLEDATLEIYKRYGPGRNKE